MEWIVRADLPCGGEPGYETRFLAVDQRVGATVPSPPLALDKAKQMDQQGNVTHVMHNMLEPPFLDDL